MNQHPETKRLHVELLGDLLAEALQCGCVVGTHPLVLGQVVHHIDTRQVLGQGRALAAPAPLVAPDRNRLFDLVFVGLLCRELFGFVEQPELPISHSLARSPKPAREQDSNLLLQSLERLIAHR